VSYAAWRTGGSSRRTPPPDARLLAVPEGRAQQVLGPMQGGGGVGQVGALLGVEVGPVEAVDMRQALTRGLVEPIDTGRVERLA
jgi:hypothetical protein